MIHCHASLIDVEDVLRWYLSTAVITEKFFFSISSNTLIFARLYPTARCIEVLSVKTVENHGKKIVKKTLHTFVKITKITQNHCSLYSC